MRTSSRLRNRNHEQGHRGQLASPPRFEPATQRIVFDYRMISVWAWPSRGGLIVLEHVTALDCEFLGLDALDLRVHRDPDQDAEDELCQRLLLLGAKWFDSRDRYRFVAGVVHDEEDKVKILESSSVLNVPGPTIRERRWVRVGYPTAPEGGFWVAEYDTVVYHEIYSAKDRIVPYGADLVQLAKSMDEKCEALKKLDGKFYKTLDDYDGLSYLNAWKNKTSGEVGPLTRSPYPDLNGEEISWGMYEMH